MAKAHKDFLHTQSTIIARNHGLAIVGALPVRAMSASAEGTAAEPGCRVRQKAGLNRAILDQGWGLFRTMLDDKLGDRGGKLITAPAAPTPARLAPVVAMSMWPTGRAKPSSRARAAVIKANADTNAAINILRCADGALTPVEEHRTKQPDAAGPSRRAA